MKARAFAQICLPLAQLGHVALWAITTMPTNSASEFNAFLRRVDDDGEPLFRTFIMSLVCDACRARGARGIERCPHVEYRLPPWISLKNVKKVKALMGATFEEEAAQELMGAEAQESSSCFREWVRHNLSLRRDPRAGAMPRFVPYAYSRKNDLAFNAPVWFQARRADKFERLMGLPFKTDAGPFFHPQVVDEWMMLPRAELREPVETIFVSIDPNAVRFSRLLDGASPD